MTRQAVIRAAGATAVVAVAVYAVLWVGFRSHWGWLDHLDAAALTPLHRYGLGHPGWVQAWNAFGKIVSPEACRLLGLVLVVRAAKARALRTTLFVVATMWLSGPVDVVAKALAHRPRPPEALVSGAMSSFPSGHAFETLTTVLALLVLSEGMFSRRVRVATIVAGALLVVAVGVGRVVLNVHYPSDVLAGWALGYVWFFVCWRLIRPSPGRMRKTVDGRRVSEPLLDLDSPAAHHGSVRRLWAGLAACSLVAVPAPVSHAAGSPWFAASVGDATQVVSVVSVGGSAAKMDVWQRGAAGWQPIGVGIATHVGSAGMAPQARDGYPATPTGVYSLDYVFGTAPSPGGGLQYVQVGPDDWWDGDEKSPTFNTQQHCKREQCPFDTSASENLDIPEYVHAVVMGVNKPRVPGGGSAFFMHATDGGPTAGCVAIDDPTLVKIIQWLRPGALIAIAK